MKRTCVVAGVALLAGLTSTRLDAQANSIGASIFAGITSASLGGDDIGSEAESKIGFLAGAGLSFGLGKNLAFGTGAIYTQRGAKSSDGGVTSKIHLNYVEIPAILAVRFPGSGNVTPFFGAGAAAAFRVGCSISASGGGSSASSGCADVEEALEADIKGLDIGLVGVAGVDIKRIRIALSYYLGMSKIDGASNPIDAKNRAISLGVGYLFSLR